MDGAMGIEVACSLNLAYNEETTLIMMLYYKLMLLYVI